MLGLLFAQLVSKIFNLCGPDPPMSQTDCVWYVTLNKISIQHVMEFVSYCDRPILLDSQC